MLAALDERVSVVSVPNVHWTDGASSTSTRRGARPRGRRPPGHRRQPVRRGDAPRRRRAAARLPGHRRLQVAARPLRRSATSTSPRSIATASHSSRTGSRAGSEDFARLVDYRDEYQPGARRFDVGQRTKFELVPMAIAALEQLVDWQVPGSPRSSPRSPRDRARRRRARARLAARRAARPAHARPHAYGRRSRAARAGAGRERCYAAVRGGSLRSRRTCTRAPRMSSACSRRWRRQSGIGDRSGRALDCPLRLRLRLLQVAALGVSAVGQGGTAAARRPGAPEAARLLADLEPGPRMESWHLIAPDGARVSGGPAIPALLRLLPRERLRRRSSPALLVSPTVAIAGLPGTAPASRGGCLRRRRGEPATGSATVRRRTDGRSFHPDPNEALDELSA